MSYLSWSIILENCHANDEGGRSLCLHRSALGAWQGILQYAGKWNEGLHIDRISQTGNGQKPKRSNTNQEAVPGTFTLEVSTPTCS